MMRMAIGRNMHVARAVRALCIAFVLGVRPAASHASGAPGARVLLDAHNCYPYNGRWADRMDRALSTGPPLAVEADLAWYTDRATGNAWSILSHGGRYTGDEPTLRDYVFERIRPDVERALREPTTSDWPLFVVNLCFKSEEPEHLRAVWDLLGEYEAWLCTAERTATPDMPAPLDVKPVLVLTGSSDAQAAAFHDRVSVGERLRLFGAVHRHGDTVDVPPEELVPHAATNYRRWCNNPWSVVEARGQRRAGKWTNDDRARLRALVDHAHAQGLWIRFYTLNGHGRRESQGWSRGYNFGSLDRVKLRWRAAIEAGVDFVATDQYEAFAALKAAVVAEEVGEP